MPLVSQIENLTTTLQLEFSFLSVIDIIIVAVIIYWIIASLRGTRGMRILYGIVFLAFVFVVAQALNLVALQWFLRATFAVLLIAIPVVFQPELRRMLEKAGQNRILRGLTKTPKERIKSESLQHVVRATETLAQTKTGALIVLAKTDRLSSFVEAGTRIDADVSEELLLNIFFPKSPLHDGAVIVRDGRIASAGSILPLSDKEKAYQLGTRHRAALGAAEETDAVIIVVSEERGTISVAHEEELIEDVAPHDLHKVLASKL